MFMATPVADDRSGAVSILSSACRTPKLVGWAFGGVGAGVALSGLLVLAGAAAGVLRIGFPQASESGGSR